MRLRAVTRVLVAGGGVAGLEALLALRDLAGERVGLTLLSPTDDFVYRPMAIAEPFGRGHAAHYPLAEIAAAVDARMVRGRLAAVDCSSQVAITAAGARLAYDALLVAVGAHAEPALRGAVTWTPEADAEVFGGLLRDLEEGYSKRIAFVAPPGVAWTLPVYELALMTAWQVWSMGQDDIDITIYTPELAPLELFGPQASAAVCRELEEAGVRIRTDVCVFDDALMRGRLVLHTRERPLGEQPLDAERVIALPRAVAPRIPGLPHDDDGFVPVDRHGKVPQSGAVWAAGDVTEFAIKQGGLAAQQADAAAESIAAAAGRGEDTRPQPFRPVLHGMMLTGRGKQWMRRELADGADNGTAERQALWWPPTKIAGRYLAPHLTARDHSAQAQGLEPVGLHVDLDLDTPLAANPARGTTSLRGGSLK